jgi:hypothetical protein
MSQCPAPSSRPASRPLAPVVPTRTRLLVAFVIGVVVFAVVWVGHAPPDYVSDFEPVYVGARAVSEGGDPYAAVRDVLRPGRLEQPLYYPATATVLLAPLGALPFRVSISLFSAFGMALLAWSLGGRERWRLWMLGSAPALHAVVFGQWSPWLTAAIGIPWLGFVWVAKPTSGLALFVGWPSKAAVVGGAALLVLSFVLLPGWPSTWMESIRGAPQYLAPVQRPAGILLLLAFVRWRQPEARMLGTLALVPHTTVLHEMLAPLFVAKTSRELAVLMALGYAAAYLVYTQTGYGRDIVGMLAEQWPYMLALVYVPALLIVLRRRPE